MINNMNVLIVCSYKPLFQGGVAPFVREQVEALCTQGCMCQYYHVKGKGIFGYLREIPRLRKAIHDIHPEIIHAHYGLSCLLANLATRKVPVVSTYHGSDINNPNVRSCSKIAMRLSAWNIFVSQQNMQLIGATEGEKCSLIPCGVNLPAPWQELQNQPIGQMTFKQWVNTILALNKKHVLFAGAFDNPVKDPELAKAVVQALNRRVNANETASEGIKREVQLIELKGYTRDQVNALMYTCDALLMTSKTEGSPQVIKEAMACGLPIVSTDVGDVKEQIKDLDACYVSRIRNPKELAGLLLQALAYEQRTNGKQKIIAEGLRNEDIAQKLIYIYMLIFSQKGT